MLTTLALTTRPATAADAPRVLALVDHFLVATPYHREVGAADRTALVDRFLSGALPGAILVIEQEAVIVGLLAVLIFPNLLTGRPTASDVLWWVEPDARGCGPQLLADAEAWAATQGAEVMHIVAWDAPGLEAFYQRLGYTKLETVYQKVLEAPCP